MLNLDTARSGHQEVRGIRSPVIAANSLDKMGRTKTQQPNKKVVLRYSSVIYLLSKPSAAVVRSCSAVL